MLSRRQFSLAGLGLALSVAGPREPAGAAETEEFEIMKTDEEWKKTLTKEQYAVLRGHGTERAGSSHSPFTCTAGAPPQPAVGGREPSAGD